MTTRITFEPRRYRDYGSTEGFTTFRVVVETSDLYVKALGPLERETEYLIRECRAQIQAAIARRPEFLNSLEPLEEDPSDSPAVRRMIRAGRKAGTGPMAAVAGEVAEYVGRGLMEKSEEVIIENGGDLFIHVRRPVVVGLFAGASRFSGMVGIAHTTDPRTGGPVYVFGNDWTFAESWEGGLRDCRFPRHPTCGCSGHGHG